MGILSEADALALEGLAEAYADLRSARDALAARGDFTYETATLTGTIRRAYPEVGMVSDADRRLRAWLSSFGLDPVSRTRVSAIDKVDAADPATRYLG
jgi:P27 family predicted phage terminase small subunit